MKGQISGNGGEGENRRTCLTVMAGFQFFSSLRIERQTVPEG